MEERRLNERESLELITLMMQNTRKNFKRGDGNILIIWGCATLFANIVVFTLLHFTQSPYSYWAWILTPIIGIIWTKIAVRREQKVITQIDKMVNSLFACITYVTILVPLAFVVLNIVAQKYITIQDSNIMTIIPFIEMLIVSIGITAASIIIGFRAQIIGGIIGIFLSLFLLCDSIYIHSIIFSVWAISSMIIPGVYLNKHSKKLKNA